MHQHAHLLSNSIPLLTSLLHHIRTPPSPHSSFSSPLPHYFHPLVTSTPSLSPTSSSPAPYFLPHSLCHSSPFQSIPLSPFPTAPTAHPSPKPLKHPFLPPSPPLLLFLMDPLPTLLLCAPFQQIEPSPHPTSPSYPNFRHHRNHRNPTPIPTSRTTPTPLLPQAQPVSHPSFSNHTPRLHDYQPPPARPV